jgi:hypothetical protein
MYTKLAAVVLLGVVSNVCLAAERQPYAFATLGQSSYSGSSNSPVALRVGGGYTFAEIKGLSISGEGAYATFGEASNSYGVGTGTATSKVKTTGLMANAVVTYDIPKVKGLALMGKLGMLRASTSASVNIPSYTYFGITVPGSSASYSSTSTGTFFGFGVKYDITKELDVRGTYEDFGSAVSVNGASTGLTMISAGVAYKF